MVLGHAVIFIKVLQTSRILQDLRIPTSGAPVSWHAQARGHQHGEACSTEQVSQWSELSCLHLHTSSTHPSLLVKLNYPKSLQVPMAKGTREGNPNLWVLESTQTPKQWFWATADLGASASQKESMRRSEHNEKIMHTGSGCASSRLWVTSVGGLCIHRACARGYLHKGAAPLS